MSVAAHHGAAPAASGGGCELAEVFARYGKRYARRHALRAAHRKALWAIVACRTAALGGHRHWCDTCGYERYVYHSCRNRHCPKCQTTATAAWVGARQRELLPVPYFHHVFTLPHELNGLILTSERNQRALLKLLFDATAQTLLEFGRTTFDGGRLGVTLVLHTWDQQLRPHYHVHALVTSGALSPDGDRWIAGGRKFLFPVRGLSCVFRAKYLDGLAELLARGELDIPPQLLALAGADSRRPLLRRWRKKSWVVYAQAPFAGPRKMLDYLGRYTHRVAITNQRLLDCRGGQVRFIYRDRRDGDRRKTMSLPADEFIGRFLRHVLPDRFMRIRHYGLLANCVKQKRLVRCRQLLAVPAQPSVENEPRTAAEWIHEWLGEDVTRCPCCNDALNSEALLPARQLAIATTNFRRTDHIPSKSWDP